LAEPRDDLDGQVIGDVRPFTPVGCEVEDEDAPVDGPAVAAGALGDEFVLAVADGDGVAVVSDSSTDPASVIPGSVAPAPPESTVTRPSSRSVPSEPTGDKCLSRADCRGNSPRSRPTASSMSS